MIPREFFNAVKKMREAQRNYFRFRTSQFLTESKTLERAVDAEIKRVELMEREKQQPRLNL